MVFGSARHAYQRFESRIQILQQFADNAMENLKMLSICSPITVVKKRRNLTVMSVFLPYAAKSAGFPFD